MRAKTAVSKRHESYRQLCLSLLGLYTYFWEAFEKQFVAPILFRIACAHYNKRI
jgi:hypothetical protein